MDYSSNPLAKLHPTTGDYTSGSPSEGIDPSNDVAEDYNQLWKELLELITFYGLTPAEGDLTQIRQAVQAAIAQLYPIDTFPEIQTADNRLAITDNLDGTITVDVGQDFIVRLLNKYSTDDYLLAARTLSHAGNKTYHLRWDSANGFRLRDLADAGYNPSTLAETDTSFDSTLDDMLVARVVTDGSNAPTITALANASRLQALIIIEDQAGNNLTWTLWDSQTINWARSPASDSALGGFRGTTAAYDAGNVNVDHMQMAAVQAVPGGDRYQQSLEFVYDDSADSNGRLTVTWRLNA